MLIALSNGTKEVKKDQIILDKKSQETQPVKQLSTNQAVLVSDIQLPDN